MKRIVVCFISIILLFSICSCKSKKNESVKTLEIANSKDNQTIAEALIANREISAMGIIYTKEATYHRYDGRYDDVAYGILTVRFSDDSYAWVLVADAKEFATIQIGDNILVNRSFSTNYPKVIN